MDALLTINVVYHFLVYFKFISCKAEANKLLWLEETKYSQQADELIQASHSVKLLNIILRVYWRFIFQNMDFIFRAIEGSNIFQNICVEN